MLRSSASFSGTNPWEPACWKACARLQGGGNRGARYERARAGARRSAAQAAQLRRGHGGAGGRCGYRAAKALVKRLLGRHPYGTVENVRREEYNALLRAAYLGREPFFDLARVESTAPGGAPVTVDWGGRPAPALAREYTDDGGHLNAAGRLRAARELLEVLGGIVRQAQRASPA